VKKSIFVLLSIAMLFVLAVAQLSFAAPVEIRYTRWAGTEEAKDFQALVNEYNKKNLGVKVVPEFLPWGAYWQKIQTTLIAANAADVISMNAGESVKYINKGVFYDLSTLSGAKERLAEMAKASQKLVTYNGKIVGMPVGIGMRVLVYNKAMFDAAGVPYLDPVKPLTWEQFKAIGKKLTKIENGQVTQYAFQADSGELHKVLISQAGGSIVDNISAPKKVTINSPEAIAALKYMKSLYDDQIIPPYKDVVGPWGNQDNAIVTGKVAIMYAGPWALGTVLEKKMKYGTAPMFMNKERATVGYVNFNAIAKNTKHPKEAWKFLEWLTSREGQIRFSQTGDLPANIFALEGVKKNPSKFDADAMNAYYEDLQYIDMGPMVSDARFFGECDNYWRDFLDGKLTAEEAAAGYNKAGQTILDEINKKR
jgi:multiple sugar transport system substrate-binding protein